MVYQVQGFACQPQADATLAVLSPQMTEGRHCQVHLLDDRRLELLVQVGVATRGQPTLVPSVGLMASGQSAYMCFKASDTGLFEGNKGSFKARKPDLHVRVTLAW